MPSVGILGYSDSSVNIISYFESTDLTAAKKAIYAIEQSDVRQPNTAKAINVLKNLSPKGYPPNVMMVMASGYAYFVLRQYHNSV